MHPLSIKGVETCLLSFVLPVEMKIQYQNGLYVYVCVHVCPPELAGGSFCLTKGLLQQF
jgi:hypothetical protein